MKKTRRVTFAALFENLATIDALAAEAAAAAGLGAQARHGVEMAVDEACANIIEHAYGGESPDAVIEYAHEIQKDRLVITLRDYGKPFDPACVPEPDLSSDIEERDVGGLGLYFMCHLMDEVTFHFSPENGNVLMMVKYKPADEEHKNPEHEDAVA
ncbi:MAG: ATP-binding protein [Anaerolineae bacterium]